MRLDLIAAVSLSIAVAAGPALADVASAKAALKAEPKIKDLHYDGEAVIEWHIGVISDGSRRYGYAQYVCGVLSEHGVVSAETDVRIVDIQKVANGSSFRASSLGRVNCGSYAQSFP